MCSLNPDCPSLTSSLSIPVGCAGTSPIHGVQTLRPTGPCQCPNARHHRPTPEVLCLCLDVSELFQLHKWSLHHIKPAVLMLWLNSEYGCFSNEDRFPETCKYALHAECMPPRSGDCKPSIDWKLTNAATFKVELFVFECVNRMSAVRRSHASGVGVASSHPQQQQQLPLW